MKPAKKIHLVSCPFKEVHRFTRCPNKCFKPGCMKQTLFELRVIELVNAERNKAGLRSLKHDKKLSEMAREKARDMVVHRYFSHKSPNYGSPFNMMKKFGISYHCAGENIASGYNSPETVIQGWMNSPGHRANIMKPLYLHIGVGYFYTNIGLYNHYWTQEFIL